MRDIKDNDQIIKALRKYIKNEKIKNGTLEKETLMIILDKLIASKEHGLEENDLELYSCLSSINNKSNHERFTILTQLAQPILADSKEDITETLQYRKFMTDITKPLMKKTGKVLDMAAGLGGLSGEIALAYKDINLTAQELSTDLIEIQEKLFKFINIKAEIRNVDSLNDSYNLGQYDMVIYNPPYDPKRIELDSIGSAKLKKELESKKVKSIGLESLFIFSSIDYSKEGGIIITTVPSTFLFHTLNKEIRELVLEKTDVLAIVDLPRKVISLRGINTSIIVLRKKDNKYKPKDLLVAALSQIDETVESYEVKWEEFLKEWKDFIKEELPWK